MWLSGLGIRLGRLSKGVGNKRGSFYFLMYIYIIGRNFFVGEEVFVCAPTLKYLIFYVMMRHSQKYDT